MSATDRQAAAARRSATAEAPALLTVADALEPLSGRRVFYDPLWGNHGDKLIDLGSRATLARFGAKVVDDVEGAEAIVVNGSGGMLHYHKEALDRLALRASQAGERPFVLLPSSFLLDGIDLPALLGPRRAPTTLIARERPSLAQLRRFEFDQQVRIGLDHDMAFALAGSPFLRRLRASARKRHILIVERRDREGTTNATQRPIGPPGLKRLLPRRMRRSVKHMISRRSASVASTAFAQHAVEAATALAPQADGLPLVCQDISDVGVASFRRFLTCVADAAVIVTNRLHVAVLGALLEKPTLVAPGNYHKIRGVHEFSLTQRDGVTLVSETAEIPSDAVPIRNPA